MSIKMYKNEYKPCKYNKYNCSVCRQHTPILYTGDINNQEEVFEFLFQNKHTAEEDVIVEDVDAEKLEILINHVDFVVVLFYAVSLTFI